jgi:hypothetical protein
MQGNREQAEEGESLALCPAKQEAQGNLADQAI